MASKVITTYMEAGKQFKIIKVNDTFYGAIDTKYIDENGRLKVRLDGVQMNCDRTVEGVIRNISHSIATERYIEEGFHPIMAVSLAWGETMEQAEATLARAKEMGIA